MEVRRAVLLGAGGHAKVVLSLARANDLKVMGVCDPVLARGGVTQWRDLEVLGGDDALGKLSADEVVLLNGIGHVVGSVARRALYERCREQGFHFPALIHPAAWIDPSVDLGEGVQVMAGVVLQPDCVIGENTIVNTRSSVDHDGRVGAHVHLAPGSVLCGTVTVGNDAFIGAGATVLPNLQLGAGAVVAAGVTVSRPLQPGQWLRAGAARNTRNNT
jgi:UDP-perosamine 4-acetyltransferase